MAFFRPKDRRVQRYFLSAAVGMIASKDQIAISLRLGQGLAAAKGWQKGSRITVLWGHGPDFGTICIASDEKGVKLTSKGKRGACLFTACRTVPQTDIADDSGGIWRLKDEPRPLVDVRHFELPSDRNGERLGLDLPPDWFTCIREPNKKFKLVG